MISGPTTDPCCYWSVRTTSLPGLIAEYPDLEGRPAYGPDAKMPWRRIVGLDERTLDVRFDDGTVLRATSGQRWQVRRLMTQQELDSTWYIPVEDFMTRTPGYSITGWPKRAKCECRGEAWFLAGTWESASYECRAEWRTFEAIRTREVES